MNYHHLYADEAGESHWQDVNVPLTERTFAPLAREIFVSEAEAAQAMLFLKLEAGWNEPVHPTPKAQTLICLRGAIRVTASDGEMREIRTGAVWRMEDLHGKGHHTMVIGDTDFEAVSVQFD